MVKSLYRHPRSVADRVFTVWRSPARFTKNPDLVQLPSGRLLLVYSDNDSHWSQETQVLTLLASDDGGSTWAKFREVATADLRRGDERLVTPRLSRLRDGRLVILIDHDDFGHFHEDQPPGNWAFWSEDDGESWRGPQLLEIPGFEPDRMLDLPDGRLAICTHVMRGGSQELAEILSCSEDDGRTWRQAATIAHDGYHRFCEGALVILGGLELACVMRENHSAGLPSFVSFSPDYGRTWSAPQILPFAFHRPYAKQLPDGRVLVTGRHVNGGLGTYAWCGDLHAEAGTYQIGGPRGTYQASLIRGTLAITNGPGLDCRYTLLPPESSRSEVIFEAVVRIEGDGSPEPVAFMSLPGIAPGFVLSMNARGLWVRRTADGFKTIDLTVPRTVRIHHRRGVLQVSVDGLPLINWCVFRESPVLDDFHGAFPEKRVQFGQLGERGASYWERAAYTVSNPTLPDYCWQWSAADGCLPDDYQRRRLLQVHANDPAVSWPDNGYSSWVLLPDGRILLVDYTNLGDEPQKSHLVGVHLTLDDLPS
jgi:sialidase-1